MADHFRGFTATPRGGVPGADRRHQCAGCCFNQVVVDQPLQEVELWTVHLVCLNMVEYVQGICCLADISYFNHISIHLSPRHVDHSCSL